MGKKERRWFRRQEFWVNDELVLLTVHAISQCWERVGIGVNRLKQVIIDAFENQDFHVPGEKARYYREAEERWVFVEGPKGRGTIVLNRDTKLEPEFDWEVSTVWDSSSFTQGDRKGLRFCPFVGLVR